MMAGQALTGRAAGELVTSHLYLVQHVLNGLAAAYPRDVDRAELWSAGALALVEASRRFDPAGGESFVRHVTLRIRRAMTDAAGRAEEPAPERQPFEPPHRRVPGALELAALVGLTPQQVQQRQAAAAGTTLHHLEASLPGRPPPSAHGA